MDFQDEAAFADLASLRPSSGRHDEGRRKMTIDEFTAGIRDCVATPPTPETTDIVWTWVNYTETEDYGPYMKSVFDTLGTRLPWYDGSQTFVELKYILRGMFQQGIMKYDDDGGEGNPETMVGSTPPTGDRRAPGLLRRERTPLASSSSSSSGSPSGPFIRNAYVFHRDGHPPRNLKEGTHGRHSLKFVGHSEAWRDPSQLPSNNRNSIAFNTHRIPRLAPWFIYSEDDQFPVKPFSLDEFYDFQQGKVRVALSQWAAYESENGYNGAMFNSARALTRAFGTRRIYRNDRHTPILVNTCAMKLADEFWAAEIHAMTGHRTQQPDDFQYLSFSQNLLLDVGVAVEPAAVLPPGPFELYDTEIFLRNMRYRFFTPERTPEFHTAKDCGSSPAALVESLREKLHWSSAEFSSPFLNLQGYGISDEYLAEMLRDGDDIRSCDFPASYEYVRKWYEDFFPRPSPFE
jgi:hypothetical protein